MTVLPKVAAENHAPGPPTLTSREWSLAGPARVSLGARAFGPVAPDRVRVKFVYCGLCGSDITKFQARGEHAPSYPLSIGHEFVATVVEVGGEVDGFEPGETVTSDLNNRCGVCEHCTAGRSHLCVDGAIGRFTNRGFADYADIAAPYLERVHAQPAPHLALAEPLSCVLHARDWARPQPSDRVLIVGAGGLGLCLAFALTTDPSVERFDVVDRMPSRLAHVAAGAGDRARALTAPDGQYDAVFDLSGTVDGLELACQAVRPGGRLCTMSHLDGRAASFLLPALTRRDVTFTVSYLNGQRSNLHAAVAMLSDSWTDPWDRALGIVGFSSTADAFARRGDAPHCKTIVAID